MELELQEIRKSMHETRYVIMQHYLFMYGNRLKGRECRAELFEGERLSLEELEDFMNTVAYFGERDRRFRKRDRFGWLGRCAVSIVDFLVSSGRVRAPGRW
ncbi:hypothetical protein, partial [Burkholderia vietnamiensis]|uniref:hypothetical protein n=1 Tax=Burkholderia vietnamiensis TaxID=60552 RepID=UPI001CF5003C